MYDTSAKIQRCVQARSRRRLLTGGILLLLLLLPGCAAAPPSDGDVRQELAAVMQAEDHRAGTESELELLRTAGRFAEPSVRAAAVRAIGRLERPELVVELLPFLQDADPLVRRQAAFALGQAASEAVVDDVTMPLYQSLSRDPDETVRATAAHALGRLPYPTDELLDDAQQALYRSTLPVGEGHAGGPDDDALAPAGSIADRASPNHVVGVLRGLEVLLRQNRGRIEPDPEILVFLRQSLRATGAASARMRALAAAALGAAGAFDDADIAAGLVAADTETRRRAAAALAGAGDTRWELTSQALEDAAGPVRTQALQTLGDSPERCGYAAAALEDPWMPGRLQAISLLPGCRDDAEQLLPIATSLEQAGDDDWQPGAAAMLALARTDASTDAGSLLRRASEHPIWQVRMYAARAAGRLAAGDVLERLAGDSVANVRHAAIGELSRLFAHAADPLYVAALELDDPQLTIAAASALEGTESPEALPGLLEAQRRMAADARMTMRDTRMAVLERVGELTSGEYDDDLAALLGDVDPVVAGRAAELLSARLEVPAVANPAAYPRLPFPAPAELERLAAITVRVHMAGGGSFSIRLLPFEAPTNAARFARMAAEGAFDGLTFHRVVANFVVQGGSPGANEYAGHGAYTRDEISDRSHLRGTVGISTRGRDTGDGQIFVNLVDNYRLDGNYTIIGEIMDGMDVVDAALEGAAIERVELVARN